ncbi:MAG: hypothetical protein HQK76_19110 [Desulfobacterales bacterium]|nr:hypothetical protein [Desulfobacterales bacterium]
MEMINKSKISNIEKKPSAKEKFLFIFTCFLLLGIGLPILIIYLIKIPETNEYSKIIFIFFVSSAIVSYSSIFFLKQNILVISVVFIISLFCCFPFIVGLKNNLTLQDLITAFPIFENWPFFLKPHYILIEFLIPAGILVYLFLQIKNIFSKKPNNYTFLLFSVYLGIAAFLGLSTLAQANQPNIMSFVISRIDLRQISLPQSFENRQEPGVKYFKVNYDESNQIQNEAVKPPVLKEEKPIPIPNIEYEQKIKILSDKLDNILEALNEKNIVLDETKTEVKIDNLSTTQNETLKPPVLKEEKPISIPNIDYEQKIKILSDKVDSILEILNQKNVDLHETKTEQKDIITKENEQNSKPVSENDCSQEITELSELINRMSIILTKIEKSLSKKLNNSRKK